MAVQLVGEGGELFAGRADGDVAGLEIHDSDGVGDGEVGAFQPPAAAQGVHQGGSAGEGSVVDGSVEEFAATAAMGTP